MVMKIIVGVVIIALILVGGFFLLSGDDSDVIFSEETNVGNTNNGNENAVVEEEQGNDNLEVSNDPLWRTAELKDVNSGDIFTINDFKGQAVLLESFAVWCPKCTSQQKTVKEFEEENTDVISISLNTDPNEDESRVRQHTTSNGFDWRYAVSPVDVTQSLVDEFGTGIVNAPSVPMIIICPDGSTEKLPNGQKSVEDLKRFVESC